MTLAPDLMGALNPVGSASAGDPARFLAVHQHPDVWLVVGALAVGYWWAVSRLGPKLVPRGQEVVSRRMVVWWYSGVALLWIFAEWPIHDLAEHYSYGIHMTEHLVFTLVCAPMMLLGMPGWMLRWIVVGRPWYGFVRFVCRPVPALLLNSGVLLATHWPSLVNTTTHNEWIHFGVHLVLFTSSLALFMPVINRIPELPRLTKPAKILYLFLQSMAPIPPTLWLIYSQTVLYTAYLPGTAYLGWSATGDQEVAGSLMGAVTPIMLWILAAVLFFSWWAEEERRNATTLPDDLTWDDVVRELDAQPDRG